MQLLLLLFDGRLMMIVVVGSVRGRGRGRRLDFARDLERDHVTRVLEQVDRLD